MKTIKRKSGFTIIEIILIVTIIGFLLALAIPNMLRAGRSTRCACLARDIKNAGHAFLQYSFEHGGYPADTYPRQMPDGMSEYFKGFGWRDKTVVGGFWDWDYLQFGCTAGVSIKSPNWGDEEMRRVDEIIDDGNLARGRFRRRPGGYIFVLEE